MDEGFTSWFERMTSDPPKEKANEFNVLGSPLSRARELALLVVERDASRAYKAFHALGETGEASEAQLEEAALFYAEAQDKTRSLCKLNMAELAVIIESAGLHKLSRDEFGNAMRNGL
jgi:hypothetical protein